MQEAEQFADPDGHKLSIFTSTSFTGAPTGSLLTLGSKCKNPMEESIILINRPLHRHHGITGYQDEAYPIEIVAAFETDAGWMILLGNGLSGHDAGSSYPAARALDWRPYDLREVELGHNYIEDQCKRLRCEWFVPILKRMAIGSSVDMSEIQANYRSMNGGEEPPMGSSSVLQKRWLQMASELHNAQQALPPDGP